MTYFAMARRWRPQSFSEVVAQDHITETLLKAIELAKVAPAYLFTGPRGSGKTTVARLIAKAVNCDKRQGGEPCSRCDSCLAITEGRSLDVLEIDGASNNSVDDVRELRENVRYAASAPGKRKVYIIDEVHMLSTGAFNALLKTLEEPPGHVLFVFATTEPQKVPGTILSRCQRFDFRRLLASEILARLQHIGREEKIDVEPDALFMLAKRADGSMRDALSLLDQVISSTQGQVTAGRVAEVLGVVLEEIYFDLTEAVLERDAVRALGTQYAALQQGGDAAGFALGLVEHLRNLLLLSIDPKLRDMVQLGELHLERARELAGRFRTEDLLYLLNRAAAAYEDVRRASQPSVVLEAAVVEIARFESRVDLAELLEKLEGRAAGAPAAGARGGGGPDGTPERGPTAERPSSPRNAPEPARGAVPERRPPGRGSSTRAALEPGTPEVRQAVGGSAGAKITARAASPGAPPAARAAEARAEAGGGAAIAAATVDLEQLCARWDEFTQVLRASKAMLAHCLSEGRPVRLRGCVLDLDFPPEHAFHVNLLQDAARRRELEQDLGAFFGQPLRVAFGAGAGGSTSVLGGASTSGGETPSAAPVEPGARLTPDDVARSRLGAIEDVVRTTPGLEDLIRAFDAEVVDDPEA